MTIFEELDPERQDKALATLLVFPNLQWRHVLDLRRRRLQALPNRWRENTTVERLLLPSTLTEIGNRVLSNVEGLEALDLSHTAVKTIGNFFLRDSLCVTRIRFPPTLESIGHSFLTFTSIKRVDLSATRVTRLPQEFLFKTPVKVLLLPPLLREVDDFVLVLTDIRRLDLSHTAVDSFGKWVLLYSKVETVLLPTTMKELGSCCFARSQLKRLDITHTQIKFLPNNFCQSSSVVEIRFPRGLEKIGKEVLSDCEYLETVDLSDTVVEDIDDWFIRHCPMLRDVRFPRTLRRLGRSALTGSKSLRSLDLRGTALESIGPKFLHRSGVESLWFPDSLVKLGSGALGRTQLLTLDLSNTKLRCLDHFLDRVLKLKSLHFPRTLVELSGTSLSNLSARNLCLGNGLVHLDLSCIPLREVGPSFLSGQVTLQTLQLPGTLERVGEGSLSRTDQLQQLDLSKTKLTELPSLFGLKSGLKALRLPPTLERIGDRVLQYTKLTRLDLSHTKVTRIGTEFAQGTPLEALLCPLTLRGTGVGFPVEVMSPSRDIVCVKPGRLPKLA